MSDPVRLVVVGVGLIGVRHLEVASPEPACVVTAGADPDPAAQASTARYDARYYADYREMLDRESPDGVIVAVPNALHAEVGIECARRGLPMLMEKPFTDTVESGRALLAAASEAKVPIAVGHHRRFDSTVKRTVELLGEGRIGRLAAVECLWSLRKHDEYWDAGWRQARPGGGPVLINLIHDVDLLRHFCGDIVRVYAQAGHAMRGFEVEDTIAVTIRFASGVLATVLASDAAPSPWGWEQGTGENPLIPGTGRNCYRFLGSDGALGFPRLELWRHVGEKPGSWRLAMEHESIEVGPHAALAGQLAHFCEVVRGNEAPRISGPDGFATLVATNAILESAASGAPVDLA